MRTLIIAELGHNWNGDMTLAKRMIYEAKKAGGQIAKFQLYDTDKLGIKEAYGQEVYDDLKLSELTRAQLDILKQECDTVGIEFLCSVFDVERVDWTEEIDMKRYKIASRSVYDTALVDKIITTGKPIIWSDGMLDKRGKPANLDFCHYKTYPLYCVSKYPTEFKDLNIPCFWFSYQAGFSDHTIGIDAALVAVSRGAQIIEKHFTLDRTMEGYDQKGSIEPDELKEMIEKIKIIEEILH